MRNFNKYDFLVSKQINKNNEISYSKFKGMELMPEDDNAAPGVKFIRDFYRGSSAYADHLSYEDLDAFHLQTELDDAIIQDVLDGKDVILTGNPGDGKTHIIRKLEGQLKAIGKPICIVLDASTLSDKEIQEKWEKSKLENKSFIIAINAAVLYSVHEKFPSYGPIDSAYNLMIKSVVFHKDSMINNNELTVYDLSKRDILTPNIIRNAIEKLTDEKYFTKCLKCPIYSDCDARNNKIILNNELFQKRLYTVLQGVSLQGYHATIRELQGFISYLIFGNRTCKKISETNGNNLYNIVNLIYSGKGNLFSAIRKSIDPKLISHPIWDEKLINNQIPENSWIESVKITNEAIHYSNLEIFNLRKRQFYFFNSFGSNLIKIKDDDMTRFSNFIRQEDNKIIKEIIKKLNTFFGAIKTSNNELQVWTGHRYDNEPRKILISIESVKRTTFKIGRPYLQNCMQKGIKMTSNYIRLEKKESPNIFLKIDFEMYVLLTEAERGVPVLFMESTPVKKVWRFIEQLQSSKIDSEISVSVLDIQNKEKLTVCIDIDGEEKKYSSIEVERHKGG